MSKQLDCLFIAPSNAKKLYQDLAKDISVKQNNEWAGLLANSCRAKGFSVAILDMEVERLSFEETIESINSINPKFVVFVATGQNPNSSSASMSGATATAELLKNTYPQYTIIFVGPHVSALPLEVLENHSFIDIILTNEGVYALHNLLSSDLKDLSKINGIGYRKEGKAWLNPPEKLVPQELLEQDLPGQAFDLLPSLDKYRTGMWQTRWKSEARSPFFALYTSLGCPFTCSFCMINILGRTDNNPHKTARDFNVFRHWSPEFIIKQLDYLASQNVKYLKFSDELFSYKKSHCLKLAELMAERNYGFSCWFYARVDSIKEQYLDIFLKAGLDVAALGIESANQSVRLEIEKGKFKDVNIIEVIDMIEKTGMEVGSNYIVGLPGDTFDSVQQTLNLAVSRPTLNMNVYSSTALPGSPLYLEMRNKGVKLPEKYSEFSFLSYDHVPTPTDTLSAADVEALRDYFYDAFWSHPKVLSNIYKKYGQEAVETVKNMNKIKLKRKLLDQSPIYKP